MSAKTLITAWFSSDQSARQAYLHSSEQIFRAHGMTSATLYRSDTALVGDMTPHAVVLLEWADVDQCRAAFASSDYGALAELRSKAFERINITLLSG